MKNLMWKEESFIFPSPNLNFLIFIFQMVGKRISESHINWNFMPICFNSVMNMMRLEKKLLSLGILIQHMMKLI